MHRIGRTIGATTGLACVLWTVSATATPIDSLLTDAEAAKRFDYCAWAHGSASPPAPPARLAELLADVEQTAPRDEVAAAALVDAGIQLAVGTPDLATCERLFDRGAALFDKTLAAETRRIGRPGGRDRVAKDPAIAAARTAIADLWVADQAARGAYIVLRTDDRSGSPFWAQRLATAHAVSVDQRSAAYLKALLARYDWIDIPRFGQQTSARAWLIVQHADHDPAFQAMVLARMELYLATGGVRKANYAFLWDRVAINSGRKQRYGTQPVWDCQNGSLTLQPLEEPATVNARRAALGMNTVEQGLEDMARGACR